MRVVRNILRGAKQECELSYQDQDSRRRAAQLHNHTGVAQFYQSQVHEIGTLSAQLDQVLEAIQGWTATDPQRIHTELAILLGLFEQANLVGLNSRPFIVRRTINTARTICEGLSQLEENTRPSGHFLVWFRQIYNLMDTLFQTRTALSMYYHSVLEN